MSPLVRTVRGMDVLALLGSGVVGAVIGFLAKVVVEILGRRHQVRTRWDAELLRLSIEFAQAGRYLLHHSERLDRAPDRAAQLARIDAEHATLRSLSEQLRLLGNARVQKTSRSVIHHAYAVRGIAEGKDDKHAARYSNRPPRDRYLDALDQFYIACRRQLKVRRPDDVERYDPVDAAERPEDQP